MEKSTVPCSFVASDRASSTVTMQFTPDRLNSGIYYIGIVAVLRRGPWWIGTYHLLIVPLRCARSVRHKTEQLIAPGVVRAPFASCRVDPVGQHNDSESMAGLHPDPIANES